MCILSNKIQLVRLFWAVSVTRFLCCDCSEDRVGLTTVRSPNKMDPKNAAVLFFWRHFVPFSSTSDFRESHLKIPNCKRFFLLIEAEISHTAVEGRFLDQAETSEPRAGPGMLLLKPHPSLRKFPQTLSLPRVCVLHLNTLKSPTNRLKSDPKKQKQVLSETSKLKHDIRKEASTVKSLHDVTATWMGAWPWI